MFKISTALALTFFGLASASADMKVVTLKWDDDLPVGRWLYEKDAKPPTKGLTADLYNIKNAKKQKNYLLCYSGSKKLDTKGSTIRRWIVMQKLDCALDHYRQKRQIEPLQESFNGIVQDRMVLLSGPHVIKLRDLWVEAGMIILDSQMRSRSNLFWRTYDLLDEHMAWLTKARKAEFYRLAGEMAYAQKKLSLATSSFEKSLKEEERESTRARFYLVRFEYYSTIKRTPPPLPAPPTDRSVEASAEELEIDNRYRENLKSGDMVGAVEDGVKLMREYPGGLRAQQASKQILSAYLSLAGKKDDKSISLKKRVVSEMSQADGKRLFEWAGTMANREYYEDALQLSQKSLELVGGQPISTEILLLLGQSAVHTNNLKDAKKYFDRLIREHAGTKAAMEAIFRRGLINYREANYGDAVQLFEKYLNLKETDYEISSLYWLWRSKEGLKNENSAEAAKELIRRFPLSYFGLRARYEINDKKLGFESKPVNTYKAEVALGPQELESWERFQVLLRGGWLSEAQQELDNLPTPADPEGKVVWAKLYGSALGYHKAFELLQSVWQEDATMLSKEVLRLAYPKEFISFIDAETPRTKLPPLLVLSLMRQESTFRPEVQSPASAMGLMQVVPSTAREVATDMKLKSYTTAIDLFDPETNIKIGMTYLQRLLRTFDGHVPLVLAAYNAGMGNVRAWNLNRVDLKDLRTQATSQIQAEIWFDELPWIETSGYIKSILRNYIIYRYLDQGEAPFNDPIWRN